MVNLKKGSNKRKSVSQVVENQSSKFDHFLDESRRRHEERMGILMEGRDQLQKRVEEIGEKASRVLDLIEKN